MSNSTPEQSRDREEAGWRDAVLESMADPSGVYPVNVHVLARAVLDIRREIQEHAYWATGRGCEACEPAEECGACGRPLDHEELPGRIEALETRVHLNDEDIERTLAAISDDLETIGDRLGLSLWNRGVEAAPRPSAGAMGPPVEAEGIRATGVAKFDASIVSAPVAPEGDGDARLAKLEERVQRDSEHLESVSADVLGFAILAMQMRNLLVSHFEELGEEGEAEVTQPPQERESGRLYRNETTEEQRRAWADVDAAADRAPSAQPSPEVQEPTVRDWSQFLFDACNKLPMYGPDADGFWLVRRADVVRDVAALLSAENPRTPEALRENASDPIEVPNPRTPSEPRAHEDLSAWPIADVLERLAGAADLLLEDHDGDGHEEVAIARDAAREHARLLRSPTPTRSRTLDELCEEEGALGSAARHLRQSLAPDYAFPCSLDPENARALADYLSRPASQGDQEPVMWAVLNRRGWDWALVYPSRERAERQLAAQPTMREIVPLYRTAPPAPVEDEEREAMRFRAQKAHKMVVALCTPRGMDEHRDWIMSIPADEARDPDLVISAALRDLDRLLVAPPAPQGDEGQDVERVEGRSISSGHDGDGTYYVCVAVEKVDYRRARRPHGTPVTLLVPRSTESES